MKLALLATLTLSLAGSRADADCAMIGLTAKPVTAPNTAIPLDGGIVIAAVPEMRGELEAGDAAEKHPFSFKAVAHPLMRKLAPGLIAIGIPPRNDELLDASGKSVLAFKLNKATVEVGAAPAVKAIEFEKFMGRRSSEQVFVTIDGLPADTIAIVLADAKGTPKSWGLVKDPGNTGGRYIAFRSRDCLSLPNGTKPTKGGDQVTVMLVDALGRLTPASKPMTVVEKKAKTP